MDQNAIANVQGTQPDPAAGAPVDANGTTPAPATTDVATGVAQTTDPGAGAASFDPEIQKFLDNQNIKTDDLRSAVSELARRNMKLRAQPTNVTDVLKQAEPVQQVEQTSQTVQSQPEHQTSHTLSDMDIANVSMFVKQQYPDVTTDATFYQSMIADGFKPTTADGQINLKNVMSYAAYKQKLTDAEKAIAANQPKAGQLPQPSNTPEYAQVDTVQNMTEQAAQNIVMFSNTEKRYGRPIHPQYAQAVEFLQNAARTRK